MGFRFSRRIRIAPGIRLNLGAKGASLSIGPRGASVTVGKSGVHGNVGLPGTGLSYRQRLDAGETGTPSAPPALPKAPPTIRLRFVGVELTLLDGEDVPIDEPLLSATRKAYRTQIVEALTDRAAALNADVAAVLDVHIGTPPPLAAAPAGVAPYRVSRPVKPHDREGEAWGVYMEALARWRAAKAEHEKSAGPIAPEPDLEAVEHAIARLDWPRETIVSLQLDDGTVLLADVDLPEIENLPDTHIVVAARALSLDRRPLSAAARTRAYARHVHGVLFRIAGEMFAADAAIREVRVAGYTQRVSAATGAIEDVYVLAVSIRRADWSRIDFGALAAVDPVAALARFDLKSAMDARGAMHAVHP